MASMIPNNSFRFMIVLNFFMVLGFAITNNSALAQTNKSIPLPPKILPSIKLKPARQSTPFSQSAASVPKALSTIKSSTSTKKTTAGNSSSPSKWQCQNKAKEASKIVFDDCMIAVKENEAENIRKEYKVKLAKLKAQYEQKLQKVLGQLKKQSKSGVVPATNEATNSKSSSTLPPKSPNESTEYQDSDSAAFSAPTPINTQNSVAADDSNTITTMQNNTITTTTTETVDSSELLDESSMGLKKDSPSTSTDSSVAPIQEPTSNDYPSSSPFRPSDKLEVEPDAAI